MELRSRDKIEAAFARDLSRVVSASRKRAIRIGPDIPEGFYRALENDVAAVLEKHLPIIWESSSRQHGIRDEEFEVLNETLQESRVVPDPRNDKNGPLATEATVVATPASRSVCGVTAGRDRLSEALIGDALRKATQWAGKVTQSISTRVRDVASGFAANTRKAFLAAAAVITGSGTTDTVQDTSGETVTVEEFWRGKVNTQLGPERVTNVAMTETTAAVSQAGEAAVEHQDLIGAGDTWRTEDDSRVCPLCSPLDDTTREVWSRTAPDGPPRHPRCRCVIEYENGELFGLRDDEFFLTDQGFASLVRGL